MSVLLAKWIGCDLKLFELFVKRPILCLYCLGKPLQCIQYKIFENGEIVNKDKLDGIEKQLANAPCVELPVLLGEFVGFMWFKMWCYVKEKFGKYILWEI